MKRLHPPLLPPVEARIARVALPRRGLADPAWRYVRSEATDVAATLDTERRRLGTLTAPEERVLRRAADLQLVVVTQPGARKP